MKTLLLLMVAMVFTPLLIAQDKSGYPLTLEVTSYGSSVSGYKSSGETITDLGRGTFISSGDTLVPVRAMISTGILTMNGSKIKCTVWNKKHYLNLGTFQARQISGNELEVVVISKKGKKEVWKFKILSASKIG